MAIYKRGDIWWVDVAVGNGRRRKRVRKSTGCKEEVQAKMIEQSIIALNRGLTSRQRALKILDGILPEEEKGLAVGDCRAFYEQCMESDGVVLSKLERQKRLNAIARMAEWILANSRAEWVSDVNPQVAWAYSCAIGERGVSAQTRNNEIGHLRTVWKMLEKHGKVELNPWTLARVGRNRDEEKHGRAFTDEEIVRILMAAREVGCEWEGVVIVALYTGLRKRDIECMAWRGDPKKELIADIEKGCIYGTPSKTSRRGVRVNIPMHPNIISVLKKCDINSTFVFPWRQSHPHGQRPKKGDCFFSEVLARAGIVAKDDEMVSFHSLRHTFVTRLADAGVAEDVRMRLAGHTNAATHGIYTHEDTQSKDAIGRLK